MLIAMACRADAAPGNFDPTFGLGGKVLPQVRRYGEAHAVVLQPDGKIIAAGARTVGSVVARYHPDGTVDRSFGNDGLVDGQLGSGIIDAALQPDGKLVVVATGEIVCCTAEILVARYDADGTLDPTFGSGGVVAQDLFGENVARAVALQPDGKIVVGGFHRASSDDFTLRRLNPDGSADASFGSSGQVVTTIASGSGRDVVETVAVQPDGKIVAAGFAFTGTRDDLALARYDPDGSLDATFGVGGTLTTAIGSYRTVAEDVVLQPDGKIVAVGWAEDNPSLRTFALARYLADGTLDAGFGGAGTVATPSGAWSNAAVLQPDGKLVVAGVWMTGGYDFALARYDIDGSLDPGFGSGGSVTAPIGGSSSAQAVVLQPDGKIVAAGLSDDPPFGFHELALARFHGGATPACGVDGDGDGVCDAIDNCALIANPTQANGDADALGDACDPCTNRVATRQDRVSLKLTKLLPPGTDDRVTFKGTFRFVPGALDPVANGVRFLVADSTGATPIDMSIPGGAYDPGTRVGWSAKGNGTAWTYQTAGSSLPPIGGIQTVRLRTGVGVPQRIKVTLKGKDGSYPIDPGNLPLVGTLVFETPLATSGQCVEASFWAAPPPASPRCEQSGGGQTVKCG